MNIVKKYWDKFILVLIMALTGFFTFYKIGSQDYSNAFYTACVKSMLTNWKNFFFVSLDPGGWVTVDKPPVSLWVQALFAKIFGFSTWSYLVPEALAAVAMVAIIFHMVNRHFGKIAGLISALALAISPIFIVVSKTNNTDTILILFMLLSAWAMMAAADRGQLRYLILSVVLLGVAYNAKTLEAFLILPALYAVYFFAANAKWRTRIWHLVVATAVLATVALSWSVIVDLIPASERPYVDNSTNNSELQLEFGYNGIQRVTGQTKGGDRGFGRDITRKIEQYMREFGAERTSQGNTAASGETSLGVQASGQGNGQAPNGNPPSGAPGGAANGGNFGGGNGGGPGGAMPGNATGTSGSTENGAPQGMPNIENGANPGSFGGNVGNSMFSGGGSPSVFRMFNSTLGGQDSWLLTFAFFTILALILSMRKKAGEAAEAAHRRKVLLRGVLLYGISVVTMFIYFDVAGFFHEYYIASMAPYLAALVGIGLVQMWKLYKEEGLKGFLLPIALAVTAVTQIVMLTYFPRFSVVLIPVVIVVAGVPAAVLIALKLLHKEQIKTVALVCAAVSFAGLLAAPAVWTGYSAFSMNFSASIPSAGPSAERGRSFGGMTGSFRNRNFGDRLNRGEFGGRTGWSGNFESGNSGSGSSSAGTRTGGMDSTESNTKLINFLVKNNTGEKWLIAVPSASEAESIIIATGKPVIAVGGFSGNDQIMTVAKLEQMVKSGQLKYYLVGGRGGFGGNSSDAVTSWITAHGKAVSASKWSDRSAIGNSGFGSSETLYDLSSYKTTGK